MLGHSRNAGIHFLHLLVCASGHDASFVEPHGLTAVVFLI